MHKELIPSINETIQKTKKAIVGIGCSFVQGHGAIAEEIYKNYKWQYENKPTTTWFLSDKEKQLITQQFLDIKLTLDGNLDFTHHEYNNSFVNVLCKKYFQGQYAPINLGRSGNGNRAAVKELYFYPQIDWYNIESMIVIYCPSGLERFDFILDTYASQELNNHHRWVTIWPSSIEPDGPRKKLSEGYYNGVYSEKGSIIEQISTILELLNFCKLHNAKLIITPSFDYRYTKKFFTKTLQNLISRSPNGEMQSSQGAFLEYEVIDMVNLWPWQCVYKPDNCDTFSQLCIKYEDPTISVKDRIPYEYLGKGSPNFYIAPCAHPSAKGHDLFARYLYEHIQSL